MDKLYNALSLAKRAGALTVGFDAVCEAVQKKEAALVLLAQDTSEGTTKRVHRTCQDYCEVLFLPYKQEQIFNITKKQIGVMAITNTDLATLCLQCLQAGGHKEEPV